MDLCLPAEVLYAKNPKLKREDVEMLQNWLNKQTHLPTITDLQVQMFLHSCNYSIQAAKTTIDSFYTIKTLCLDISEPLSKSDLDETARVIFVCYLPVETPQMDGFLFVSLLDNKIENFNWFHFVKLVFMASLKFVHTHGLHKEGVSIIFDMKNFTFGHLAKINISLVRNALYCLQEGAPIKITEIHVLNSFSLAEKALIVLKPFLKLDLLEVLHFHLPGSSTLDEFVSKGCLPEDYGGELPSMEVLNERNIKDMLDVYELILWVDTLRVDESRRVGSSKVVNNMLGIDGSFRRLEID